MKLMSIILLLALGTIGFAQSTTEVKLQEARQTQLTLNEKELAVIKKEISQIKLNITKLDIQKEVNQNAITDHNRYLQKLVFEEKILTGKINDLKDKLNKRDANDLNEPIKLIDDKEQERILSQIKHISKSLNEKKDLKENQKPLPVMTVDTKIIEEVNQLNHFEKEVQLIIDESSLRMVSERFKRMRPDSADYEQTRKELETLQEKVNVIQNALINTQGGKK